MSEPEFPPVSVSAFSSSIGRFDERIVQHELVNLHLIAPWFSPVQAELSHPLLAHFVRQLLHPCGIFITIFCTLFSLDFVVTSLQAVGLSQYRFGDAKTLLGNPQLYFEFCLALCICKFQSRFTVSTTQRILVSASCWTKCQLGTNQTLFVTLCITTVPAMKVNSIPSLFHTLGRYKPFCVGFTAAKFRHLFSRLDLNQSFWIPFIVTREKRPFQSMIHLTYSDIYLRIR